MAPVFKQSSNEMLYHCTLRCLCSGDPGTSTASDAALSPPLLSPFPLVSVHLRRQSQGSPCCWTQIAAIQACNGPSRVLEQCQQQQQQQVQHAIAQSPPAGLNQSDHQSSTINSQEDPCTSCGAQSKSRGPLTISISLGSTRLPCPCCPYFRYH